MDPATLAAMYGGGTALSALGSFFGGKSQADAIKQANEQNAALTRESWQRDDTAVQRRTQDLVKAGLNPALAAGSAASTSAPLPMQAAANTGPADALKAAGQSISAWPTVEQALKRSAAQTLQSEASAELTSQQAQIAEMDKKAIKAGNDPRDKTPINQIIKLLPRLMQNMSPGGAIRDVVDTTSDKISKSLWGDPKEYERQNDMVSRANRLFRAGRKDEARALMRRVEAQKQGGK